MEQISPPLPPLAGIRVLELGSSVSGPFAARLLADLGAEVIKVEPHEGDQLRTWGTQAPDGTSWWFKSHNRGKKLVAFDLRDARAVETVKAIARRCDVLLENFRPGRLAEWGLGYDALRAEHPGLIYVSISGYGQEGPYADRPGYGNVAESMGGLRFLTGFADRPPVRMGISLGDQVAALYAVIGTLAALEARRRDGAGDYVDVALTEACFSLTEAALPEYAHTGVIRERSGNRYLRAAPSNIYPTKDGRWMAIGGNGQGIFRRLAAAMGRPELADDPRFATNLTRVQHSEELDEIIGAWTATLDSGPLNAMLVEAAVPAGPVMSIADIAADPQFRARGMIAAAPDEQGNEIVMPGIVPKFRRHATRLTTAAGAVDRDAEAVLRELGLADVTEAARRA
ncbi:MAG TPA: CoA transferase [Candidatus Dormibacteraeota bacterium]|nr:CoA transferase [Candidatus Dormibacteraeota bacterium]